MGLLDRLFEKRASAVAGGLPRDSATLDFFGGGASVAGPVVSEANAMTLGPVWACVQIIAETLASLPFFPFERLSRGRRVVTDHSLYKVLHQKVNPSGMTPMDFRQTLTAHVLTWGNGFAEIVRNKAGAVTELWPLNPANMRLQIFAGKVFYYVRDGAGKEIQLRPEQVLHLRGLGNNGFVGYSVITMHRETLGLTKAEEEYRARFFSNDGRPGGVLIHPGKLSKDAYDRLRASWAENQAGLPNKHKPAILEESMKWQDVGIPPKDFEFIAGRKFQLQECARIYRVPLVLLQEHENSTTWGSGIEQFMISFVTHTLRPWAVRWEQQANLALLTEGELEKFYLEHKLDALLRGDSKARAEFYSIMRNIGAVNADEIRDLENMNPIEGGAGGEYWRPANMQVSGAPVAAAPAPVAG